MKKGSEFMAKVYVHKVNKKELPTVIEMNGELYSLLHKAQRGSHQCLVNKSKSK